MIDRIDKLIDEGIAEIATAGWLPRSDRTGTVFEPTTRATLRRDGCP
jgi:hypothetical protein